MFKILPIQNVNEQAEVAKACGGICREGFFAYAMRDAESGEIMGFSQFEINGDEGYISELLEPIGRNDFEAMFILGRQTMNFIDTCGAHICHIRDDGCDDKLIRAIGFKHDGKKYSVDMTGMFDGKCGNH